MKRNLIIISILFCVVIILSGFLPENFQKKTQPTDYKMGDYSLLNINNLTTWGYKKGGIGSTPDGDAGVFYPAGSSTVIFTSGLIWGGYIHDPNPDLPNYRFGGQGYELSTVGGRVISLGNAQDPADESVRIYRIRKDWQSLQTDDPELKAEALMLVEHGFTRDTVNLVQKIIDQYQKDWQEWPAAYGAPFYDMNKNGIYKPDLGETPGLADADQVLWLVVNDLDEKHTHNFCDCPPIGLEIQQTVWGYDQPGLPLGQTSFQRWRIINKSGFPIDSIYAGMFVDPDIGDYSNDLVGCDTTLQAGFAYNAYQDDQLFTPFGIYPPAIGYQLVQGPIIHAPGANAFFNSKFKHDYKNLPLKAFSYSGLSSSISDLDLPSYTYGINLYHMLRGFTRSGDLEIKNPYIHKSGPDKGKYTKFPLSGNPLLQSGDVDNTGDNWEPGDRRFIMGSGPFSMAPGDTQEVVYALIGGLGNALYPYCVEELKLNARYIQNMYPELDGLNDPFPQTKVNALSNKNRVTLEWGSDTALTKEIEQNQRDGIYRFEGYNIYQLPSPEASDNQAILIESIDSEDGPAGIFGYKRDPFTGIFSNKLLVNGSNSGIRHYTTIELDYFTNQPFQPGQTYTFAVSAYRYIPKAETPFPIIESKLTRINVLIHEFNPGYSAQTGQEIEVQHSGFSTGYVKAVVVNPAALTGHTYRVSFNEEERWTLRDLSTGEVKLTNRENISGDENFPIIDGIMPVVWGPSESGQLKMDWDFHDPHLGVIEYDWGGQVLNGGIGLGADFFGSTVPNDSLIPVRIEFQMQNQVEQNGWAGQGAVYLNDSSYTYIGVGNLPVKAFDIRRPDQPRRLNICFTENSETSNRTWDMGWDGTQFPDERGADEYLFIMNSSYNTGNSYDNGHKGTSEDVLYALWLRQGYGHSYLEDYGVFDILPSRRLLPQDSYVFSAPEPPNLPTKFKLLPAYPNPFNGSVRFRFRIPNQAKVKIELYDINGRHVAHIFDKKLEQGTHSISWRPEDLASGMYFYKVAFCG